MKSKLSLTTVLLACSLQAWGVTTTSLALRDGSTIKAEFKSECVACSTIFAESLALKPDILKSVSFSDTNGAAKIEFVNGDRISATILTPSFKVSSMLGELDIPRAGIRSMTLTTRQPTKESAEDGLIFHCTFDDEEAVTSPLVGPGGRIELGRIQTDADCEGGALFVNRGIAGARFEFPAGFLGKEGTIEFHAKMASGKTEFSTGGDPRFLVISAPGGREFGSFEFASNDGGGNSGICATLPGIHCYSNEGYTHMMPYSEVFHGEDFNGWHHYAMTWTSDKLSVLIDGKLKATRYGQLDTTAFTKSVIILDIPLSRQFGKSFNNKSDFLMDDLKVWNKATKPQNP